MKSCGNVNLYIDCVDSVRMGGGGEGGYDKTDSFAAHLQVLSISGLCAPQKAYKLHFTERLGHTVGSSRWVDG